MRYCGTLSVSHGRIGAAGVAKSGRRTRLGLSIYSWSQPLRDVDGLLLVAMNVTRQTASVSYLSSGLWMVGVVSSKL